MYLLQDDSYAKGVVQKAAVLQKSLAVIKRVFGVPSRYLAKCICGCKKA